MGVISLFIILVCSTEFINRKKVGQLYFNREYNQFSKKKYYKKNLFILLILSGNIVKVKYLLRDL